MKVSDLLVRCLENEGVRYVFGVPGEEIEDLLFSLAGSRVRFVPTRHEQGAAFMADAWGRLSGRAGVCLSTLGPGATNLVTGIADAHLDKSPVVAITGQGGLNRLHRESHQFLDILAMFRPITKWNSRIGHPDIVPEVVRKAFKVAESEKPGATHLELPEDVAAMQARGKPLRVIPVRRPDPDVQALRDAARLLKKAKHPVILAGNGAVRKPVSEPLASFAEKYGIAFVNTFMGQGAISDNSACSLFTIGLGFRDFVMEAIEKADLVVAVGYDIAEYSPEKWNPDKDKKILHVDYTPAEVHTHYRPDVEIVADIGATFRELGAQLAETELFFDRSWYAPIRARIVKDIRSYSLKPRSRFHVPGVLNVLREIMADEDLLISDVGSHKLWIARNFPVNHPNGCLISNGLASMGFALPAAVAASLYQPQRRIVAAMGDGGFLMNSQELETAKRLGCAFTTLIFNDNDYGLISWKQKKTKGRSVGTRISNPDFKHYAESFGLRAYRPGNVFELRRDLKSAVHRRELSVVEVCVDTQVNQRLDKKLAEAKRRH